MTDPIVLVSSYSPRLSNLASFTVEAHRFLQKYNPDRHLAVVSHIDADGLGVLPIIDLSDRHWWRSVAAAIRSLRPHVVHLQHEFTAYEYFDNRRRGDSNEGFLELLEALAGLPTIVELQGAEAGSPQRAEFYHRLCSLARAVLVRGRAQQSALELSLAAQGWPAPSNTQVVPRGIRGDRRYGLHEVAQLRRELGLSRMPQLARHLVGLVGWCSATHHWNALLNRWGELVADIRRRTGQEWDLLTFSPMRECCPGERRSRPGVDLLPQPHVPHAYEFVPQPDTCDKLLGICDFAVLPCTDASQADNLARIIALNKPYVAASEGDHGPAACGRLTFRDEAGLREAVLGLACDEHLRLRLGEQLRCYVDHVADWKLVTRQYAQAYSLARRDAYSASIKTPAELA